MDPIADPPPSERSRGAATSFHLVGAVLCIMAGGYATFLAGVQLFFNLGCDGDAYEPYLDEARVRSMVLTLGLAFACIPAVWAGIAKLGRFTWQGWAGFAFGVSLLTGYVASVQAPLWGC